MPSFHSSCVSLIVVAALCAVGAPARADQAPALSDLAVPVTPVRKGAAPVPRALATLPPGADRVTPLTLHVRVTTRASGRAGERRQAVTRTTDRVHIVASDGAGAAKAVEWLFERNPVDPRRASATYVAHAAKTIVVYSDSDLQTMLGIAGWVQVLMMGVEPAVLGQVAPSSAPRAIEAPDGTRLVIESASATVDLRLVQPAELRFPSYRVVTVADWLEEH